MVVVGIFPRRRCASCPLIGPQSVGGKDSMLKIISGGLDDVRVRALLEHHVRTARAQTAPGSAHALDLDGLNMADVKFWSAWDGEALLGVGALKQLSASHGEIKSMHTSETRRRTGVGRAMLAHIIDSARKRGMDRVSLETGAWEYFRPARAFYRSHGFVECGPFGDYVADPNSVFMTFEL
jgi:putative acetyltransferase